MSDYKSLFINLYEILVNNVFNLYALDSITLLLSELGKFDNNDNIKSLDNICDTYVQLYVELLNNNIIKSDDYIYTYYKYSKNISLSNQVVYDAMVSDREKIIGYGLDPIVEYLSELLHSRLMSKYPNVITLTDILNINKEKVEGLLFIHNKYMKYIKNYGNSFILMIPKINTNFDIAIQEPYLSQLIEINKYICTSMAICYNKDDKFVDDNTYFCLIGYMHYEKSRKLVNYLDDDLPIRITNIITKEVLYENKYNGINDEYEGDKPFNIKDIDNNDIKNIVKIVINDSQHGQYDLLDKIISSLLKI